MIIAQPLFDPWPRVLPFWKYGRNLRAEGRQWSGPETWRGASSQGLLGEIKGLAIGV